MKFGVGQPLRRFEDARLLAGNGRYQDDVALPRQAHAVFVRSPHAHARIGAIDTDAASRAPGVLAVYTGADYARDGLGMPKAAMPRKKADGSPVFAPQRPALVVDRARHVGDPVAMVVAETLAQAKDAADAVDVAYDVLPATVASRAAVAADAPRLWDAMASNVTVDARVGDAAATDAAFARAAHVVRFETWVQRVTGVPMEPRATLGDYEPKTGKATLYAGGGGVVRPKRDLIEMLGLPEDRVRVIARDTGGNFGTR
ncbi:MAG: xanthine dehydrogenase family protein molybdopterin-binding subunit, partial [Acetobacteraceae bacterium]|nr:xanthine dehydrogenase family protein molybdopterin-binding subunit [Acetobacteraceae bacterium]